MALPLSGPLSFDNIRDEFNPISTAPIELSDYYKGGALVPNIPANADIPFAGEISVGDFYGASSAPEFSPVIMGFDSGSSSAACDGFTSVTVYQAGGTPNLNNAIYTNSSGTTFRVSGYYSLAAFDGTFVRYWTGTGWSGSASECLGGGGGGFEFN